MPDPDTGTRSVRAWGCEPSRARAVVVAVHGRGQTPDFMAEQARRLAAQEGIPAARLAFLAPHAESDSWYPLPFQEPLAHNRPQLDRALDVLDTTVTDARRHGLPVVLWGFSQGACLVAHYLLTSAPPVAGAAICTGGYIGQEQPVLAGPTPVRAVLRSIDRDPFVPPGRVRDTAELLRTAGAQVDLRIDPGDNHGISDEAIQAIAQLFTEVAQ